MSTDNLRDVGLLGHTFLLVCMGLAARARLRVIKCFKRGLLFQMFQHSTAVTFFFFFTSLFLQEPINMLITTKWSGCELQSVKMTDGPQIFPSPFLKKRSMTENIRLTRPLVGTCVFHVEQSKLCNSPYNMVHTDSIKDE